MPKIQIHHREYEKNGKIYSQFRLTIPQKVIDMLNWNGNDEIEIITEKGKMICKNKSIPRSSNKKIT